MAAPFRSMGIGCDFITVLAPASLTPPWYPAEQPAMSKAMGKSNKCAFITG
jgi:hypothetical protein